MIFNKARFEIWNATQHPFKHNISDFAYTNEALPGISNIESALDYILAVIYPQTKDAVATTGDLPVGGNTINDFRVVQDDGDGKAAAYRWEQREGEASPSWHKIYDMDWGADSILSQFLLRTQDLYVYKYGLDDLDGAGAPIAGVLAGQTIFGGQSAGTNLTLKANSGDGVGAGTGFVQIGDHFRPIADATYDLGTALLKLRNLYLSGTGNFGTLAATSGSITDSSGAISFGDENLSSTGNITGAVVTGTTSLRALVAAQTITLVPGLVTDSTGAISFDNENLSTTGTLASGTLTVSTDMVIATGSITSASGAISFSNENLSTTGTLSAGNTTVTRLDSDNLRVDANTISVLNSNGNLNLLANGTGIVDVQSPLATLGITATGVVGVTGQLNIDNLRLDGNTLSTTNANGDLIVAPNGTGLVSSAGIYPTLDSASDLGKSGNVWNKLWIDGAIGGATEILVSELLSLKNVLFRDAARTQAVQTGDALFYDAVSGTWLASSPDTEIAHASLSGLTTGDAGHTQFVVLAGRAGGQTVQGGTAASENLTLESTSHVTKGFIYAKDPIRAFTDASFSGSWSGTDIGGASNNFRDVYTKGEFRGFRFENFTSGSLPSASAANVGRTVFSTDDDKLYTDNGGAWVAVSVSRYISDTVWNGSDTTKTVTVSSTIADARNAIWVLKDNTNNFEQMFVKIEALSATQVRISVSPALPAGSYRLVGIE